MTTLAVLQLVDQDGQSRGELSIRCLPKGERWGDLATLEITESDSIPDVRLLEETDYQYRVKIGGDGHIAELEPSEIFSPNSADLVDGRLRTGRVTGTVRVSIVTQGGNRYTCDFEVRSRKLNYETEYRRMMLRLAEEGAELLQSSFAPGSFGGFQPDQISDAQTLYQRFAFLESLLDSEVFAEAVDVIRHRPYSRHEIVDEVVDPTRSLKPARDLARQLARPTGRQQVFRPVAGMESIPRTVTRQCHIETLDTVPNRFLRFAFEHWKALAGTVADQLEGSGVSTDRGRRDARRVEAHLDHLLTIPAVAEAGLLHRFPGDDTVLTGRAGYREILRSFLLGEVATSLVWQGGSDVFSAGKRDVATLYEYWVFLELARVIESIPGFVFDRSELVARTKDGLGLNLRRGDHVVLGGRGRRRGRLVDLELVFNRTFGREGGTGGSWTASMRPDCSLRIQPAEGGWNADTWVHFDAKYRINQYSSIFDDDAEKQEATPAMTNPKSDDLRKMHAYRDAIRRTAGAYVLYPGENESKPDTRHQYHEVLPGIGAFVLRPSENGQADPVAAGHLRKFLTDVIDHVASQGTGRERALYWEDVTYAGSGDEERRYDYNPTLELPPADSSVLLGFVRSPRHRRWVAEQRLYNLRADPERNGSVTLDSPVLNAEFVVLYDSNSNEVSAFRTTGALYVRSGGDLRETGYPAEPGSSGTGTHYLCLGLGDLIETPINGQIARELAPSDGSPVVRSWDQLAQARSGLKL